MPGLGTIRRTIKAATKKRPGRRSKKGRPIGTKAEKKKAADLDITVKELRKREAASQKKSSKKKKTTKKKKHTKKERAEIARLAREQRRDEAATRRAERDTSAPVRASVPSGGRRLPVFAPPRSSVAGQSVEAGPLRSKIIPPGTTTQDRVSPARKRHLVATGQATVDPKTGLLKSTGEYAPPAREVMEEMRNKNQYGDLIDEKDVLNIQGMRLMERKRGGKIKTKKSRGVGTGAALRGLGAVRKK